MTIDKTLVIEAINKMAFYLCSNMNRDGKFLYRVHKDPEVSLPDTYNVLRHAGSIYALSDYAMLSPNANKIAYPRVKAASRWLRKHCGIKTEGYRAIVSNRKITGKKEKSQVKLGANALAILGYLGLKELNDSDIKYSYLEELTQFLLYMQKHSGDFYSKYYMNGGLNDEWNSLYYPGEAAFALSEMYKVTGNGFYLGAAFKAMSFVADKRRSLRSSEIEADHWSLLATNSMLKYGVLTSKQKDSLIYHASQIVNSIVENFSLVMTPQYTCRVATRLEGLIAFMQFAREYGLFTTLAEEIIEDGISFLLFAYERGGSFTGGIVRQFNPDEPDERSGEIRIDYVQHSLSAMIGYFRMI